jgi:hypothetical protein
MRIAMKVIEHIKQKSQKPHQGHNRPEIPQGMTVYLIKYLSREGYFTYGYQSSEQAQKVIDMMVCEGTDTEQFYHFNSLINPELVIIVRGE